MVVFSGNSAYNQAHQSDLIKLSSFLKKKHSKKPPTSPSLCAWVDIHFTPIDYSKILFHDRLLSWAKES
jgi:hypothetical protein